MPQSELPTLNPLALLLFTLGHRCGGSCKNVGVSAKSALSRFRGIEPMQGVFGAG